MSARAAVEVIGVVLAAGDGHRMGGSKALLLVGDEALAVAHARRMRDAGAARVVVAVRPEVLPRLPPLPDGVRAVASRAADPAGSLAVAIHEGEVGPDAIVLLTPVDCAPVAAATIRSLLNAMAPAFDAATPRYGRTSGHPVACRARALEAYRRDGEPHPPLRDVLRALGERRARVDVDDPLILVDLDTPDDVVRLTGAAPRFVG